MDGNRSQWLWGLCVFSVPLLVCALHVRAQEPDGITQDPLITQIPIFDDGSAQELFSTELPTPDDVRTQKPIGTRVPVLDDLDDNNALEPIITQAPPSPEWYEPNLDWLEEDNYLYRAYSDFTGAAGGHREVGQSLLFIPFAQDEESLFFADIRGNLFDNSSWEGNFGLAYRRMIDDQWIVGAYGFYDVRRSQYHNNFNQGSLGFELLSIEWDFRLNGYIPDMRPERVNSFNRAFVSGNNVVVQAGEERAYWGTDFEVGRLLKTFEESPVDAEIRGYVGGYYFDNHAAGFQQMTGPRARVEFRMFDLPYLGNGSRVVLAGQYQHDDLRGSQGTGMLTVRIPLPGNKDSQRLTRFQRRMVTPIIRDIDIIVNQGHGAVEQAKLQSTGQVLQDITVIDANTVDAEQVFADAGPDSVVVFDGSAGVIDTFDGFVFNPGQLAAGGGKTYTVVGCNTGAVANISYGSTPTVNVTNEDFDVFTLANDATLIGMNITGGRNGVRGNNLTGFTIACNHISGAGEDGVRLDGDINGNITDNTVTTNGGIFLNEGVVIENFTGGNITGNTFTNNRTGFEITGVMSGGLISNNTSTGNDDFGFKIDTLSGGQITNNTATVNESDGFRFRTISGGEITNNTSSGNISSDGFQVNGNITGGTMSGNMATGNDDDGFKFSGPISAGFKFTNNMATGNGQNGFVFESPSIISGGMIANNTATGNMEDGFEFRGLITGGMIAHNMASSNSENGFQFDSTISGGTINHNTASDNGDDGFQLASIIDLGTFTANHSTGNIGNGYLITDVVNAGTFTNNTASNNELHGFSFVSAVNAGTVTGNSSIGNGERGFNFIDLISFGDISNNTASGNASDGFGFLGFIDGGTINNNISSNNTVDGFFISGFSVGNTASFADNEATNNTAAGYNVIFGTPQTGVGTNTGSGNGSNNNF